MRVINRKGNKLNQVSYNRYLNSSIHQQGSREQVIRERISAA